METVSPETVIASLVDRTKSYLANEANIDVTGVREVTGDFELLKLQEFTAIISIGGKLAMLVAFSFPQQLVDVLYRRLTAGIRVPLGEEALYRRSTIAEIANVIIGHCTADIAKSGDHISISPPVLVEGSQQISRLKDAMFDCISLDTAYGSIDIDLVGPHGMFEAQMKYLHEVRQCNG